MYHYKRIICLAEEFTETLYLLGKEELIAGISGFTVRPPEARKTKPKVCTYLEADYDKITSLQPDLILAFSDLQADICRELIKRGFNVFCFNQRSIEDIFTMMVMVGSFAGAYKEAVELTGKIKKELDAIKNSAPRVKPKIYFEEWYDPLISGIRWVEEIIEICGGINIFPELKYHSLAKDRIIKSEDVISANPDIILASWCGKGVKKEKIINRPGWDKINAVKNVRIYEIKSSIILQPGPASLTEGAKQIAKIISLFINK